MSNAHTGGNPFSISSQLFDSGQEDPERVTAGRYRLPDLKGFSRQLPDGTLVDPITGEGSRKGGWQRVTNLVKAIADARALDLWHQRLLILGMVKRSDLYDLACATVATTPDEELRVRLEEVAGRILAAAGADEGANLGTAFHGFTEAQDLGMMHYARRIWHGKLRNYRHGLAEQGLEVRPEWIERKVVVLRYGLAGTLDRILYDRINERCLTGDLKSQKKFWTWLEIAAQLAAYSMADAMWDRAKRCYVEMPAVSQDEAVVTWMPREHPEARTEGAPDGAADGVDFFSVDLEKGRAALELCKRVYDMRSEAKSVKQTWGLLRPSPMLAVTEAYARRLGEISTLAEGSALWAEIVKAGLGETAELIEVARERVAELTGGQA